jgi:DNA-binding SARP family transcriptional activator
MADQPASPPHPAIRLFGTPAIIDAAGQIAPVPASISPLLAYVLLFPTPISRERLAETLWPDRAPGYARRRLSDALYRLRRQFDPSWLNTTGSTIAPGSSLPTVDLWAFEHYAAGTTTADLQQAIALYQADLLADLEAEWALPRRLAVRELFLDCLLRLGRMAEADQQPTLAAAHFRRLAAEDPLREEAHQGLMRTLARSGRYGEALEAYSTLERLLDAELGLPPTTTSAELAAQIRAERAINKPAQADGADRFVRPPFVGRVAERARLLERLEQARAGRGGLVLVLGEAGIGKSRLLAELEAAAAWRGWKVGTGNADETRTGGLLTEALTNALQGPRAQQLARLVPAPLLAIATRLVPGLTHTPPPTSDLLGVEQLAAAIAGVLAGLSKIAPHLFLLDDIHWAAPDLWPLLNHLAPLLADLPVLIVMAGRSEELHIQPAWQYIEAWDAAGTPRLHLNGLGSDELAELVLSTGVRSQQSGVSSQEARPAPVGEQPNVIAQLNAASNGNPLIALTLLRADALNADAPPPSLSKLVERRLALLPPAPRRAVQAAAVLGARIDYGIWEAMLACADLAPEQVPPLAGALERDGFLTPEGSGYRFAHDTLRSAIYRQLAPQSRRRWHAHALAVIRELRPHDSPTRLYHAEGAADKSAIVEAALAAGDRALQSIAPASALGFFSQALTALPPTAREQRYTALLGRTRAANMLADTATQQHDLAELAMLADALADPQRRLEVLRQQVELAWTIGALDQADALAHTGLELARSIGHAAGEAALHEAAGRVARHRGAVDLAERMFHAARAGYVALHDQLGEAVITDLLGGVAWSRGDYPQAVTLHGAAADQFHALGATFHEARALNKLGSAYWGMGDFLAARATHERSLAVCEANGDRLGVSDNLDNLGGVAWVLGDYPSAISFYERALALRRAADNAWGISISLGNLGSAYKHLGDPATALAKYDEALEINRAMGRRPGEAYVQHGRGLIFLDQGRLTAAHEALQEAYTIRCALDNRDGRIETCGALALFHLATGQCPDARQSLDEALALLTPDDRAPLRQWVYYVAYCVCTAEGDRASARTHLQQAHAAMHAVGAKLPPSERAHFLHAVPLNRQVQAALEGLAATASVQLARAATPLGRSLTPADYTTITWTLHTPADDLITPADVRRRTIVARLITEAQAQGAIPTDDDLAAALGVSRRTILRDMAVLHAEGLHLLTRRRKAL